MKLPLRSVLLISTIAAMALGGCNHDTIIEPLRPMPEEPHPDVDAQLNPGEWGLELLDPKDYPDMRSAFMDRAGLEQALDKSIQYMNSPSSARFFPSGPITHSQALTSLMGFKQMLHSAQNGEEFQQKLLTDWHVYTSKGYNRKGDVWFTGYYTPIYQGSLVATPEFKYPVYKRPADLVSDTITGDVQGRRMPDGKLQPYPTRQEIETSGLLKGQELVWFRDKLEPYIVQIQGSAKVTLTDGQTLMIGYAGKNGRDYKGLGQMLVEDKKIEKRKLSLPAIREYFKAHPDELDTYINRNDSFAFLKVYDAKEWPSGSLGVQVTATRTLATDKTVFPRAAMTFITTDMPNASGEQQPQRRFVLDQDTGGAIRAAGRGDIYMGIGEAAGQLAGRQYSEGRLYYLFLKPGLSVPGATVTPAHPAAAAPAKPVANTGKKGKNAPAPTASDAEMFPGAKK